MKIACKCSQDQLNHVGCDCDAQFVGPELDRLFSQRRADKCGKGHDDVCDDRDACSCLHWAIARRYYAQCPFPDPEAENLEP